MTFFGDIESRVIKSPTFTLQSVSGPDFLKTKLSTLYYCILLIFAFCRFLSCGSLSLVELLQLGSDIFCKKYKVVLLLMLLEYKGRFIQLLDVQCTSTRKT